MDVSVQEDVSSNDIPFSHASASKTLCKLIRIQDFASWKLITLVQTIVALVLILVPVIYNWPYLSPIRSLTAALLPNLASLESLLPVVPPSRDDIRKTRAGGLKIWRQILLVLLGLVEVAGWMAVTGGYILQLRMKEIKVPQVLSAIGMVFVWVRLHLVMPKERLLSLDRSVIPHTQTALAPAEYTPISSSGHLLLPLDLIPSTTRFGMVRPRQYWRVSYLGN